MEADRVWYRPKFNIPFFCSWLPEFCLRDMRDPRSYFMFFLFFLRLFFCLCSMNYSHGYGPIVWMKVWLNYQPMTSYVIFIFLSCYLALAQMHGTLPYYLFSSWIIIIISVTFLLISCYACHAHCSIYLSINKNFSCLFSSVSIRSSMDYVNPGLVIVF